MQKHLGMLALAIGVGAGGEHRPRPGVISGIDYRLGLAKIAFGDLSVGQMAMADVLVLKDKNVLYKELMTSGAAMDMKDFKVVFQVNMLQERSTPESLLAALELLKSSPGAIRHATVSLESELGLSLKTKSEVEIRAGR